MKNCKACKQDKPEELFIAGATGRMMRQCRACRAIQRARYNEKVDRVAAIRRDHKPVKAFNLYDIEANREYHRMRERVRRTQAGHGDNFRLLPYSGIAYEVAFVLDQIKPRQRRTA